MPETEPVSQAEPLSIVANERRAWVRLPSSQKTLCQANTAQIHDIWLLAQIRELSQTGVGLLLVHPFDPGTTLTIEPIQGTTSLTRTLEARVIHARRSDRGGWLLGCEFTLPLSAEELQMLL